MNCMVPVPAIEEQEKIADLLHAATEEIDGLQMQLEWLNKEKKALMQQLLTGKRRVKISEENDE